MTSKKKDNNSYLNKFKVKQADLSKSKIENSVNITSSNVRGIINFDDLEDWDQITPSSKQSIINI